MLLINYLEDDLTPTASQTNEHHLPSALLALRWGELLQSAVAQRRHYYFLPAANASTSLVADVRQADAGGDVVPAGAVRAR